MARKLPKEEIKKFIDEKIHGVMDWYTHGEAIDCQETRDNMNKELGSILPAVEKKFNLKKIPYVLRVRSYSGNGDLIVRAEKLSLC